MADVQIENGYTRIANTLLDALSCAPLSGTQHRVMMLILRETYGYQRKACSLSEAYIGAKIGVSRQRAHREIRLLLEAGVLAEFSPATFTSARTIGINKHFDAWNLKGFDYSKVSTGTKYDSGEESNLGRGGGIKFDATTGIKNDSSTGIKFDSHIKKDLKKKDEDDSAGAREDYGDGGNRFWEWEHTDLSDELKAKMYDSGLAQVTQAWKECAYPQLTGYSGPTLIELVEDYSAEWVLAAVRHGDEQGKKSLAYVRGTLAGWKRDGGIRVKGREPPPDAAPRQYKRFADMGG